MLTGNHSNYFYYLQFLLGLFAFGVNIRQASAQASPPVIDLGYGKLQGTINPKTNNTQFFGIRYAAAPVGPLRWQSPRLPPTTTFLQIADSQPPPCFQAGQGNAPTSPFRIQNQKRALASPSEDCLFLNVFSPGALDPKKRKLPVVVWIHGGGYMAGSATGFSGTDFFDGNDLIDEAGGGVVAVIIQYRLGLFGFLPGSEIKKGGALNAGLLDQQFALRWVQQHITKFGGDPNRVTIWGESAGAGSVLQHIIANDGRTHPPLFRAAITSSSFLPSQYRYNDDIPETLYKQVVQQANCTSAPKTLDCLRTVDAGILQAANGNIGNSGFFGTFVFVPVVDGTFIMQRATEALKQRKVNGEVLLSFTNSNEGALFINSNTASTVQVPHYVAQLFPRLQPKQITEAAAQYVGLGSPITQVTAIMSEAIFVCPTYFLLQAFAGRAFKGEFAIPPGGHGNDVSYYFPSTMNPNGVPAYNNTDFDTAFAETFMNFVMALNPNIKRAGPNITPTWNTWAIGRSEMLFNRTEGGAPDVRSIKTSNSVLERCRFWESVGAASAQ